MAFRPPNFNLTVNIWRTTPLGAYAAPDVLQVGTLPTKHYNIASLTASSAKAPYITFLALPKLTDIRADQWNGVNGDLVEVPAGSHRFYHCLHVDDVGKGWPNEYRMAWMYYLPAGSPGFTDVGALPAPVPLP